MDMWNGFVLAVLVLLVNTCQGQDVSIHPANQKVSEYSPVLFTCMTSRPDVKIDWEMKRKVTWTPITDGQYGIKLSFGGKGISSLEISRADVKKHKRLYRCRATSLNNPNDVSVSTGAKLRIARTQRLHAKFPHILPIKSEGDILLPVVEPNTVAMQCRSTLGNSVRGLKWRWIKDGNIDLSLQSDYPNRIQIEDSGILRIKDLSMTDSGSYTCVATNQQGTAYGTPFRMNVAEAVNDGKCHTRDGQVLEVGQEYNPNNDPCQTCQCNEGNQLICRMVACIPASCGGSGYTRTPGTCCEYTCDDEETTRVQAPAGQEGTCLTKDGVVLQDGQEYNPSYDPCQTCRCHNGNQILCRSVICAPPNCEGRGYTQTPGTCCNYTCDAPTRVQAGDGSSETCIDRDGQVPVNGGFYMPTTDPCFTCLCVNGRKGPCRVTDCQAPTCANFTRSRDTCCKYTCIENPEALKGTDEGMCTDRDGMKVADGAVYLPEDDPCMRCECDKGKRGRCLMVACTEPSCPHYVSSRDKCCDYTCIERVSGSEEPLSVVGTCLDIHGNRVRNGSTYQPDPNPCQTCMCVNGRSELCAVSVCDAPPCRDYILIPGTCCGFTCPGERENMTKLEDSCEDVHGNRVRNGSNYQPDPNPCQTCMCVNGRPQLCAESVCDAPPCRDYIRIPGTCCGFTCQGEGTDTSKPEVAAIRNGKLFVQQVGPTSALVQWQYPNIELQAIGSTTITFRPVPHNHHGNDTRMMHTIKETAMIDDLDPNMMYEVTVTSRQGDMYMMTSSQEFSLDGRATQSLRLNDAVGELFESRGAIDYDGFSLPRRFDRVVTDVKFVVSLNIASFHRSEVAFYDQAPCPKESCGLIRFYIYGVDGTLNNAMSLLFTDDKDFVWAKAHL